MILTIDLEKESAAGLRRAIKLIEQALAEKEPSRPEPAPAPLTIDYPERSVPAPERHLDLPERPAKKKEPVFDLKEKKEDKDDKDRFSGIQVY